MTILNDLRERVAGYVYACPDKDLMKLDIDALGKIVNAEPCDITVMFNRYMGTTFIGYKNMEITSRIFTYLRNNPGISLKELAKKFACKRVKELDDIFESILLCKLGEYLAIVRKREKRYLGTNRKVIDTQSGRSGEDELRGVFTQPALSPHQN